MKYLTIAGTVCIAVLVAVYLFMNSRTSAVDIPTLTSRGSNASSEFINAQKSVDYYRGEIRQHPERIKNYIELAQLFLQEARITGRHHEYIPKAQYLIDQALIRNPQSYDAMVTKAAMMMTMHHFAEARELSGRAVSQQPHSAAGYGVLCDAEVETGDYAAAVATCDEMLSVRPDLRSYARASYLRELHGDTEGAIQAMKLAADAGVAGQENRAWALYNLGKLFLNEGKLDTAAFIFRGILQERTDYAYAMSGLAMVYGAEGKTQQAVDLLSKAAQLTPEHLFVEQLADLYRYTGQKEQADGVSKIVLQMFEQHEQGGWNVNREYAMFCANQGIQLEVALQRARTEYSSRPANIDVLEAYAWVLYKLGRPAEALPLIQDAMKLKTRSCTLAYHAAKIYEAAGQPAFAQHFFDVAKSENRFVNFFAIDDTLSRQQSQPSVAAIH